MRVIVSLALILCLGCAGSVFQIDSAIAKHRKLSEQIELGDDKEKVLGLLQPTQLMLGAAGKLRESYYEEDDLIEIYYFRSARQPDYLTTDDEFTPYVFTNGRLTAIGWTALGGPKSRGQVIQPAPQVTQTTIIEGQ